MPPLKLSKFQLSEAFTGEGSVDDWFDSVLQDFAQDDIEPTLPLFMLAIKFRVKDKVKRELEVSIYTWPILKNYANATEDDFTTVKDYLINKYPDASLA